MKKIFAEFQKYIINYLVDPLCVCDKKKNIVFVNLALTDLLNYKKEKLPGKPITLLSCEEEAERFGGAISRCIETGGRIRDFSTFFLTQNKQRIPVSISVTPLEDAGQRIIGAFITAYDSRQLHGLIQALGRAKSEMEQRVRERTKELEGAKAELEEAKTTLEIRIQARTKELRELAESLDERVEEKTKELQEKIEELERFRRLAVGRELKMVELKGEMGKLKGEIDSE